MEDAPALWPSRHKASPARRAGPPRSTAAHACPSVDAQRGSMFACPQSQPLMALQKQLQNPLPTVTAPRSPPEGATEPPAHSHSPSQPSRSSYRTPCPQSQPLVALQTQLQNPLPTVTATRSPPEAATEPPARSHSHSQPSRSSYRTPCPQSQPLMALQKELQNPLPAVTAPRSPPEGATEPPAHSHSPSWPPRRSYRTPCLQSQPLAALQKELQNPLPTVTAPCSTPDTATEPPAHSHSPS